MADGFEVITSALLVANVGVDRGVSGRSRKVLALSERDVLVV